MLLFYSRDFSPIIVPLQSSLTVTLPVSHEHHNNHNPFPGVLPKIIGFDDKVDVKSGRAVATPYLGTLLGFWAFGRFQVSETAMQPQNLKLMIEMQSMVSLTGGMAWVGVCPPLLM